jgi:5'-methylthioinosine phosphorylase
MIAAATRRQFAIVAGSGFQELGGGTAGRQLVTRFGAPSSPIRDFRIAGQNVLLLARHGDDLRLPPHAINYRANMQALKQLNVDSVIAMNTVGVIRPERHPGEIAIPDQLVDYTSGRGHTIHDGSGEKLEHIDFTEPFSRALREQMLAAASVANIAVHDGGVYGVTQGPRLETTAEVDKLEKDGIDYVGMTAMPEAALACELGMQYVCLSLLVNYAAGRGDKPIHADIEACMMSAKTLAMALLNAFFASSGAG